MQMWQRKWEVNFKRGTIQCYHVDFQTKHVHAPHRWIGDAEFIKDGFKTEREAKRFFEKYKFHYARKMAETAKV